MLLILGTLAVRFLSQGFSSVNQVPASYFQRRKRLRVRIAKVTAPGPSAPDGAPKGAYARTIANGESNHSAALQGSDGEWERAGHLQRQVGWIDDSAWPCRDVSIVTSIVYVETGDCVARLRT